MTLRLKVLVLTASILCVVGVFLLLHRAPKAPAFGSPAPVASDGMGPSVAPAADRAPTLVYAHNLMLRQGPSFRAYVRWLRGKMLRTHALVNPSFDDPESFVLEIDKGVITVKMQDIVGFLNSSSEANVPLKHISIQGDGDTIKVRGTVQKIIPLPVEIDGKLTPEADGRVRFHAAKIDVLKIPLKSLLGKLHLDLADMVHASSVPGIQIADNDIFFDTQKLLPAPHLRGRITSLAVVGQDVQVIYGDAKNDEEKLSQWHNFLRLTGGTLDFGKLTMRNADLTMIDASDAQWFDLDLVNYQAQLVNGYSRMTPQAGLEIYMPAASANKPAKQVQAVTLQWLKNRNDALPVDVPK